MNSSLRWNKIFTGPFFAQSQWFSSNKIKNSEMRWPLILWEQVDSTLVVVISVVVNAENAIYFSAWVPPKIRTAELLPPAMDPARTFWRGASQREARSLTNFEKKSQLNGRRMRKFWKFMCFLLILENFSSNLPIKFVSCTPWHTPKIFSGCAHTPKFLYNIFL